MTTIHPPTAHHTTRPALISAFVLALVALITLTVLAVASNDATPTPAPTEFDGPPPATGGSGHATNLGDWDVLCFKPAHRDAPACLGHSAQDLVTSGRLP